MAAEAEGSLKSELVQLARQIRAAVRKETDDPDRQLNIACAIAAWHKLEHDKMVRTLNGRDETLYKP